MKKLITLLLTVVLATSCFLGCTPKKPHDSSTPGVEDSSTPDSSTPDSSTPDSSTPDISVPEEGEEVEIDFEVETGASILTYDTTPLDTSNRTARQDSGYTYRSATTTLPTMWNVHNYQSNDANTVLGYTEDSLFEFDYNLAMDGFRIVPGMAADYPTDVTENYAGSWGIDEDTTSGYAYKVTLRQDLKFENGDPIKAVDFIESMKRLLDPKLANYRADSYYSGNFKIYNAENYFYSGRTVYLPAVSLPDYGEEITSFEGLYLDISQVDAFQYIFGDGYTNMETIASDFGKGYFNIITGTDAEGNPTGYNFLTKWGHAKGEDRIPMTQEIADDFKALFTEGVGNLSPYWVWADTEIGYFSVAQSVNPPMDFSEVGYFVDENDPYSFIFILSQELVGFDLLYSLSGAMSLVHTATYDACITESQGVKTCDYATSKETYVGFGPYKLSEYIGDNRAQFVRNENWYGYALSKNDTFYHTTNIDIKVVRDEDLKNEFLAGNTDAYGLKPEDMADYQGSKHTYFTDGDSTWFVAINPDFAGLEAAQAITEPVTAGNVVNKTVLTVKEFRQAMSFSIDRAGYALALDPQGGTAKALFGNMIISDPLTGTAYRTTDQAKDTILKFWGLYEEVRELGYADGQFETRDDAIASITGYDLAGAKALFDKAYAIAVADGLIPAEAIASGAWEVQIMIGQPGSGSSAYYNNGYEYLKKTWTDAVAGTAFEGHLTFKQSAPLGSSSFSNYLKNNTVDVLFGVGWTGSALNPYGLMEAYVAPNYQYDPGWNTAETMLDIEIEGLVLRASVYDWGAVALGGSYIKAYIVDEDGNATADYVSIHAASSCDPEIRLQILAAVECAVLEQYDMIPVNLDASAALKGMKIKYGTEEYVYGVGRGGIKYMTYNYSDAEWATFVAENAVDNVLNYK